MKAAENQAAQDQQTDPERQRAADQGKAPGRRRIGPAKQAQIVDMLTAGTGIRTIARAICTGNKTMHRMAREMSMAEDWSAGPIRVLTGGGQISVGGPQAGCSAVRKGGTPNTCGGTFRVPALLQPEQEN